MAFDKSKDKTLWEKKIEGENDTLMVSVMCYNDGVKKLQIGPRTYEKKNGEMGFRKAGRITVEELKEILACQEEILKIIEG